MQEILLLVGIFSFASFTQGLTGFGFGIICMPLLSILFSPGVAVAMNVIAGSVNCVYNYILIHEYVNYRESLKTIAVSSLFIPIGAVILIQANENLIFILLGLLILAITAQQQWGPKGRQASGIYRRLGLVFMALTGLVAGAFASPGPVLAPYYYAKEDSAITGKANLQFIFSVMNVFVITSHVLAGNLTTGVFLETLPFLPIVFIFTKIGSKTSLWLRVETFRRIVFIALSLLALYLIVRNVWVIVS